MANFVFTNLLDPSPQAARSVARAILHIIFLCRSVDSFTRILHLSGYPQGRDRFTSSSVCKLYVDANGIKVMPRIGYVFLCKQYMYKSSKHLSTRAAPATRTPGLLSSTTTVSTLFRCGNSLSPHLSCYPSRKSRLEGGRKVYVDLPTVWCQIKSCT